MSRKTDGQVIAAVLLACTVLFPGSAAAQTPDPGSAPTAPIPTLPVGVASDYQLSAPYPTTAAIVVRDQRSAIAPGAFNVCYVNAFQTQPGRKRWWQRQHPRLLLRDSDGQLVRDPNWKREYLLDISTAHNRSRLHRILRPQLRRCAERGFDAVEPDNLDSWTRSAGRLRPIHAIRFSRLLAHTAHTSGLAIAQKNARSLLPRRADVGWDFAVVEDCGRYHECRAFVREYSGAVLAVEYSRGTFRRVCARLRGQMNIVLRDRRLASPAQRGHLYATCVGATARRY